jgi:hypothetical protein
MPAFPSNTIIDTVDRFRTQNDLQRRFLSPNLLINPTFQHIRWPPGTFSFNPNGLEPNWLRYAPGWFPFGFPDGPSRGVDFNKGAVQDSPFGPDSGIEFEVFQDRWGGMVQEIVNPALIRGRRVRISGCYQQLNTDDTAILSIYLKGQKVQGTSSGAGWASGGLGELGPQVNEFDGCVLAMYAGNGPTAWDSSHPVNIPLFDYLYADDPAYYFRFNGGENTAASGSATNHSITTYTLRHDQFGDGGFTGVPATDGSFELFTDAGARSGVPGTYYFEAFVDIPDDDDLFEDGACHLVVFPNPPGSAGGMNNSTSIRLYSINLEVVLDEANLDDRILYGTLVPPAHPLPYGDGTGRLSSGYILRNPIYVPQVYPMFDELGSSQGTQSSTPQPDEVYWSGSGAAVINEPVWGLNQRRWTPSAASDYLFIRTPNLPPGSSVVKGSVHWRSTGGDNLEDIQMFGAPSFLPAGDGFPYTDNGKAVLVLLDGTTSGATPQTSGATARRNRVGLYWNENAGVAGDDTLVNGTLGSAEHYVLFRNENGGDIFDIGSAWMVVATDPRLAGSAFQVEP